MHFRYGSFRIQSSKTNIYLLGNKNRIWINTIKGDCIDNFYPDEIFYNDVLEGTLGKFQLVEMFRFAKRALY